jgi:hypothetical protein
MAMAHDALATIFGLQVCMLAERIRDLGLYSLSQQATGPQPEDFGELVVEGSWLESARARYPRTRHIAHSVEKWRRQAPPRYAALPIRAVTNLQR